MSWGVNENGFQRPTLEELTEDIKAKFVAKFTDVVGGVAYVPSTEPESILGVLSAINPDALDTVWQAIEDVYYSLFILTAVGVQLDRAASPTLRRAATQSSATVAFVGDPGSIIPSGSIFETEDKRGYALQSDITLDSYGEGSGTVLAVVAGLAGNAPIAAISFIPVFISGLDTVSNTTAALNGLDIESDADFRDRLLTDREADRTSSLQAIVDAVAAVTNVSRVKGFENTGNSTDGDGLPPGSVEIVTRGSATDQAIADAIFDVKGAGIGTHGSITTPVVDASGDTKYIKHSHVTDVDIYVRLTLTVDANYNATTAEPEIRQRFLDYIGGVNPSSVTSEGLDVSEDVYAWKLQATLFEIAASSIPGIVEPLTKIGTVTGDRTYDLVEIAVRQKAITDFSKIDIVYTS